MRTKYPNIRVGEDGNAVTVAGGRNIMSASPALIAASAVLGILLATSAATAFSPVNPTLRCCSYRECSFKPPHHRSFEGHPKRPNPRCVPCARTRCQAEPGRRP
jgi:hypothetical protein